MNELIKELIKQSELSEIIDDAYQERNDWQPFVEKFTELIVAECMSVIKQNENASLNVGNFTDEKKQGIQLGLEFAITDIAEHFGVEE